MSFLIPSGFKVLIIASVANAHVGRVGVKSKYSFNHVMLIA